MTGKLIANHLEIQSVKQFLDAVDSMLNSNTFFLCLPFANYSMAKIEWQNKLKEYFESDSFDNNLLWQDSLREWYNYKLYSFSDIDSDIGNEWVYDGRKFKRKNEPKFTLYQGDKIDYLVAMLTDEGVIEIPETGIAFSCPHTKGMSKVIATDLVKDFIEAIFEEEIWYLWTINPDFLYSNAELNELSKDGRPTCITRPLTYFEGQEWLATDSASLLISDTKAFVLLTNGMD
jgi:hypothetical protein